MDVIVNVGEDAAFGALFGQPSVKTPTDVKSPVKQLYVLTTRYAADK